MLSSRSLTYFDPHKLLASIQVMFRVVVCHLRTNNNFKLRVLMYHEFRYFLYISLKRSVRLRPFCMSFFMCFSYVSRT